MGFGCLSVLQTSSTLEELFVTVDQQSYKITRLCLCELAAFIQPSKFLPIFTVMTLLFRRKGRKKEKESTMMPALVQ